MSDGAWGQLLLVAAALHVGLELVVRLVVYPALADGSSGSGAPYRRAHERHVRRMSIAVAPVYGLLVVAAVGSVVVTPAPVTVACLGLVLATFAVTGLSAVPAHEAIVAEPDPSRRAALHRRLARADRIRLGLAAALLALAWLAAGLWTMRPVRAGGQRPTTTAAATRTPSTGSVRHPSTSRHDQDFVAPSGPEASTPPTRPSPRNFPGAAGIVQV